MNVRIIAILGALALSVILLSVYFVLDREVEGDSLRGEQSAVQVTSEKGAEQALETPVDIPQADSERAQAGTGLEQGEQASAKREIPRSWPESETRWVEARLTLPAGTPGDERAQVLALVQGGDHGDVYGAGGPAAELHAGQSPGDIDGLLAAAAVDGGGTARLALPPGFDETWLVVSGAYLYTLEAQRVDLTQLAGPVELRPVLGARISGRLIGPPVEPEARAKQVEGVGIELDWSINAALQLGTAGAEDLDLEAVSDAQGRFEFRAVPVGKPQMISTADSPLARTFHEDINPKPGEHVSLELDLLVGGTVRGRVVDESGSAVAEASVRGLGREFFGNPTERLRETQSDDQGRFELTGLTPGKVFLRVQKDDYQVLLSPAFELADREVREYGDIQLSEGLALAGSVVFPDGRPAPGAVVSAQPDLSENIAGSPVDPRAYLGAGNEATADETGAFRIKALGVGPWVVSARLEVEAGDPGDPGGTAAGRWNVSQGVVRAPADGLRLSLEPPVTVSGIVVDGQQQPVPSFSLRAELAGSQWYMPPSETREEAFESEDGRFTLTDLRSGAWTFTADAPGYARSVEIPLELPSEEQLSLVLLRPVRLAGSVVDPEGQLVAGAEVSEELEGTEVFEAMQGRGDWPVAHSDDQGRFSLEVAPGAGSIVAKKDGFAPSEAAGFELAEGEEMLDLVLTMRRGGTISGEVYGKDGALAPGCVVILQMPTLAERHFKNTDADGGFAESGLKPGTWQVQAFPGIESLQSEDGETLDQATLLAALEMQVVELADEGEEHVVLGAPPEDPVRVHGQVTLDEEPLGESIISFVSAAGGGMQSLKIESLDDEGRYSLELDEPGDYLVTVQTAGTPGRQNSIEFRRSIPSGESFELDFELPLARVSGRVFGPDGEPLAQARVTLTVQGGLVFGTVFGGQYTESATDADGKYEITCLRPGSYTVAAGGSPFGGLLGSSAELGRMVQTIEVDEGESLRGVDFRLEAPGRVEGTVRDAAGKPVAGASIFLRDADGNLVELFSLAQTNGSGKFEYPGLAPGEYTVTARGNMLASAAGAPVRVRSGETSEVTVVVSPGTMLLVTLVDKTGADIRSRVSVLDADDRDLNGMLGLTEIMERYSGGIDNTVQRIGPLPAGSYKVRAIAEDGRSTVRPVHLTGQPERKLKLRLK